MVIICLFLVKGQCERSCVIETNDDPEKDRLLVMVHHDRLFILTDLWFLPHVLLEQRPKQHGMLLLLAIQASARRNMFARIRKKTPGVPRTVTTAISTRC